MRSLPPLLSAIGVFLVTTVAPMRAADTRSLNSPAPQTGKGKNTPAAANDHMAPNAHSPNPNASANSNAVQAILQTFDASRNQVVAERQALIDQLAAAQTESERQTILAQLRDEQNSMRDVQRATAKEIRAELQNLRRQRAGGG